MGALRDTLGPAAFLTNTTHPLTNTDAHSESSPPTSTHSPNHPTTPQPATWVRHLVANQAYLCGGTFFRRYLAFTSFVMALILLCVLSFSSFFVNQKR